MRQKTRPGLRSTIMLIATSVVVLATLAVTGALSFTFSNYHLAALQSRAGAIGRGLAQQAERLMGQGLPIDGLIGFEEQCAEIVATYPDIEVAFVARLDGRVLFHSDTNRIGTELSTPLLLSALQNDETVKLKTPIDDIYYTVEPIHDPRGERIASVITGFARSEVDGDLRRLLLTGFVAGLVTAISGLIVLFLMLNRFVIRPITSLIEVFHELRERPGDYSARVPSQGDDEIGVMVDGFNNLLDQIEHRERELTAAREASDRANKAKSDFLAAMSHDLRTPMHAVLSMNELMLASQLTEKQRRYAQNTQRAGQLLLGIINDILAYARIESGKLEIENAEFDPRVLVDDVVRLQTDFAQHKHLTLTWNVAEELPGVMTGDAPRLMQMLTNLLSNAIKFTDEGCIHIEVAPKDDHVIFSVRDTGIGIEPDKLSLLFQPFTQIVTPTAKRRSGTGLGLSIVKQLAEAMGGEVGVDSLPDQGAHFWFSARLQPATHPERVSLLRYGQELSEPES